MARGILAWFVVLGLVDAAPAAAQARASLGVGLGTVRFEGGSSFSTASLSPQLHYAAPTSVVDLAGVIASLPAGVWASEGGLDLWGASPPLRHGLRLGGEAILAGTTRSDGAWTGAAHGIGELLWSAPRWGAGLGAGPSGGWIADQPSVTAFHSRARLWWRPNGTAGGTDWQVAIEPTYFLGAWFTDASAGVTLERGPAVLALWSAARLSATYGSKGVASAFLKVFVAPSVSLEVGGGSYLPDPYQGLPRAGFFTVAARLHSAGRPARAVPTWPPLVPEASGDSVIVRFRFNHVQSVALAGDWNAWQSIPLRPVGADLWEGKLALARGLYHFNLLVDGSDWVVPNGVATVPDGLGGMVAILLVP